MHDAARPFEVGSHRVGIVAFVVCQCRFGVEKRHALEHPFGAISSGQHNRSAGSARDLLERPLHITGPPLRQRANSLCWLRGIRRHQGDVCVARRRR